MKVALILASNIWFAPYVRIYTRLMDEAGVDYSIISWNRDGQDKKEGFQYEERWESSKSRWAKLKSYLRYARYIKRTIKQEGFDRLIVFGPQIAILISCFLRKFKRRFVLDYRDLSIDQIFGLRQLFAYLTKISYVNVVSSPGFLRCLPKRDYLISHNFNISMVKKALQEPISGGFSKEGVIDVLTIGGIRDYSSNIEVIKALGNKGGVFMRFVGKGEAANRIKSFCDNNSVSNVLFHGYYEKIEEPAFIKQSSFLNIFYPRRLSHDTALSNRFYNSLIYKRPMIVTKDTVQGAFAEQYNVGIALASCDDLYNRMVDFLKGDYIQYCLSCNKLLNAFMEDEKAFSRKVIQFVTTS